MANFSKLICRSNRFRCKSNTSYGAVDVFHNIQVRAFTDNMADTLAALAILRCRYFHDIQQIGITVDRNNQIPIAYYGYNHSQPPHLLGQICQKSLKMLTVKVDEPLFSYMFMTLNGDDHLYHFFTRHYQTPKL